MTDGAGDHAKGFMQGFGCMFFSDGGHYKGTFDNGSEATCNSRHTALTTIAGEMHGSGVLTQANSVVYCGIPVCFSPALHSLVVTMFFRNVGARGHSRQRCENNHLKLQQMCGAVRKRFVESHVELWHWPPVVRRVTSLCMAACD